MAARFWVGGSGNLDGSTTTHISASSGGAGGATYPGSGDTLTFDASSNATAYTVTVTGTNNVSDLVVGNPTSGLITFAGSSAINIFGSFTGPTGGTWTYSGTITFSATATGKTITTNGITFAGPVTFNGTGGGWTFQDTHHGGTQLYTLTAGTLNTNSQTVTWGGLTSSVSSARTLTMGSSSITCSNTAANTVWNFATTTGLTVTANTATINIKGADFNEGTFNWNGASLTIGFTGSGQNVAFRGTSTWANITVTGFASGNISSLSLAGNKTVTSLFTANGATPGQRLRIVSNQSQSLLAPRTITAASVSCTNVNFTDIVGAGAGNWDLHGISGGAGDGGGNSGITFTSPLTLYWFKDTGNFSTTANWFLGTGGTGGAGRIPLIQDTAVFDANSFSASGKTITFDVTNVGNLDFSAATNSPTLTTNVLLYGYLKLAAGMTVNTGFTFVGRNNPTVTSAGCTINSSTISVVTSTLQLLDSMTLGTANSLTYNNGTLDLNSNNLSTGTFNLSTAGQTRTFLMGSGTVTLTGTGTVFNVAAPTTITCGTSTIKITDASASAKTFTGGGSTFYNLWITGAGSGTYIISDGNTFNNFKDDNSVAHTVQFTATTTTTVATWTVAGSAGKLITMQSTLGNSAWTLSCPSGYVLSDYLSLQDSAATGGALFYPGTHSTSVSGNSGWRFGNSFTTSSFTESQIVLSDVITRLIQRSFTETLTLSELFFSKSLTMAKTAIARLTTTNSKTVLTTKNQKTVL